MSAGTRQTIIIDMENNVWSFGYNNNGELGLGDNIDRLTPTKIPNLKGEKVSTGIYHTIMIGTRII